MTGVLLLGVFVYIWKIYFQDLDLQTFKGFCPYYTNIFIYIYVIIDWEKIAITLIVIALYANLTKLPSSQDGWSED